MFRSMKALCGYRVRATDSMAGTVCDFLFDDDAWTVTHMVVDVGSRWFSWKKVLVRSRFLGQPEWEAGVVPVQLTRAQLSDVHPPRAARSSARERELEPHSVRAGRLPGADEPQGEARPGGGARGDDPDSEMPADSGIDELSLRSGKEIVGYRIDAVDGYAGRVQDFIVDDESWIIRYMVVDTGRWLPGKKVLVIPLWIESMAWAGRSARVGLHKAVIAASREYAPSAPVNREYEVRLYDYYGRPKRWR
jgi:hypothetical protein